MISKHYMSKEPLLKNHAELFATDFFTGSTLRILRHFVQRMPSAREKHAVLKYKTEQMRSFG